MLVFIEPSHKDEWIDLEKNTLDYFEDLIQQHTRNSHFIAASRRTITFLEKSLGNLSRRSKEILNQIKSQSLEHQAVMNQLRCRIEINSPSLPVVPERTLEGDVVIWKVSLLDASTWLSQPSSLFGENLGDAEVYEHAGKQFAVKNGLPPKSLFLTHGITGGCGSAPDVVERKMKEKLSPVILVLDSDKLTPDHVGSASIKKCHGMQSAPGNIFCFRHIEKRELENAIPMSILEKAILDQPPSPDRDKIIKNLDLLKNMQSSHPNHYNYIDLKAGTCNGKTKAAGNTVEDFFSTAPILKGCTSCKGGCTGIISPPLVENILKWVCEFMGKVSPQSIANDLSGDDSFEWLDIGASVYSMGFHNRVRLT